MKSRLMVQILALVSAGAITGCIGSGGPSRSSLAGDYTCIDTGNIEFDELTLGPDGKVKVRTILLFGEHGADQGTYEIDGDKIVIKLTEGSHVFTVAAGVLSEQNGIAKCTRK